jgi:ATP-dependent exoDNAse (exonuclease V) beta subunit
VRGFIDVLASWRDDELWVLDYKTDVLAGASLAAAARERVREHYGVQLRLYALAADRVLRTRADHRSTSGARRLAGMLFAFVRYGIVVPIAIGDDAIAAWTDWLARLAVRAGGNA